MMRRTGTARSRRSGFTMIEMLVVMMIIALLIALLVPAVMKVQDSARRAEAKWQIDQISMAADQFCNLESMGKVGYLPTKVPFNLKPSYVIDASGNTEEEAKYLMRVFPGLEVKEASGVKQVITGLTNSISLVDGNQIAVFFLTGGVPTQFSGFSNNPRLPFSTSATIGEVRKGPFLQLKDTMYSTNPPGFTANGQAWLMDPYKSPLAIFSSGQKRDYLTTLGGQSFVFNSQTVTPYFRGLGTAASPKKFESPKGIQIISAGSDKLFAPGGNWDDIKEHKFAMDDLGNFSPNALGYGPP